MASNDYPGGSSEPGSEPNQTGGSWEYGYGQQGTGQPPYQQGQPGFEQQSPPHGSPGSPGYGSQGYPGYGSQPGGGQPPYSPGQPGQGSGSGGGGKKLGFIIGGSALALVLIAVLAVVGVKSIRGESGESADSGGSGGGVRSTSGSSPGNSASSPGSGQSSSQQGKAADVVRDYLQALADGDAKGALGYLDDKPSDTSLMTDKVLQVSNKEAPITEIDVRESNRSSSSRVSASYKIGSKPVQHSYSVSEAGDDYRLKRGYTEMKLRNTASALPITINGVKVKHDAAAVFPGHYAVDTSVKYLSLGSDSEVTMKYPGASSYVSLRPELTDAGQKMFQKKVTKDAKTCVKSKKLKTDCGLDMTENSTNYKDGTVERKLKSRTRAKLQNLEGTVGRDTPTLVTTSTLAAGGVHAHAKKSSDGKKEKVLGSGKLFKKPSIDLTDSDLKVRWD